MVSLKLFLWENVLYDYNAGVMFALAHDADEARESIVRRRGMDLRSWGDESGREELEAYRAWRANPDREMSEPVWRDLENEPRVIEAVEGFYVWGSA